MKLPRAILFLLSASLLGALPPPSFTLPPGAAPKKYTVELTVDPNRDTFEGFVQIEIELAQPQAVVWLNAKDLTVREATVHAGDRTQKARAEPAAEEFLAIETDSPVGPGNVIISIRYQGRLNEKSVVGPYRKRFNGDWYVYTTFTPIDARRAFPCFDEPRFKTPWS